MSLKKSRSVIIPTRRSFSTTNMEPLSDCSMILAASPTSMSGLASSTSLIDASITDVCKTCAMVPDCRCLKTWPEPKNCNILRAVTIPNTFLSVTVGSRLKPSFSIRLSFQFGILRREAVLQILLGRLTIVRSGRSNPLMDEVPELLLLR